MVWICNLNIHHSDIRKLEYLECYLGYTNDLDMRARKVLAFLVLRKNKFMGKIPLKINFVLQCQNKNLWV